MDKEGFNNLKKILKGGEPDKKIQVGYGGGNSKGKAPSKEGRKVGEEWEEHGKRWKLREDGSIEHLSDFGRYNMPYLCPNCGSMMKAAKDRKVYYTRGTCLNCLVDYHEKLRRIGKLDQFAFRKRLLDSQAWYQSQVNEFDDFVESINKKNEYVLSDGRIEKWGKGLDTKTIEKEYREYLSEYKTKLDNSINKYEEEYGESLNEWTEPE